MQTWERGSHEAETVAPEQITEVAARQKRECSSADAGAEVHPPHSPLVPDDVAPCDGVERPAHAGQRAHGQDVDRRVASDIGQLEVADENARQRGTDDQGHEGVTQAAVET